MTESWCGRRVLEDIRAPTLYDLYAGTLLSLSGAALDPHTNTQVGFNTGGGGNPNLQPEIGDNGYRWRQLLA